MSQTTRERRKENRKEMQRSANWTILPQSDFDLPRADDSDDEYDETLLCPWLFNG